MDNSPMTLSRLATRPMVAALVCIAPVLLYQALYTNAFYPITEGWFSTYGWLIGQGAVPYRDFPLLLPPLYPMLMAAFQWVFGTALLPLHVLGVLLTGLLGLALFQVLRNLFPVWAAGIAAAVGLLYYQSGNAFIGYDFTQLVTVFMLAGTALLLQWTRLQFAGAPAAEPSARRYLLLAGVSFACALLTKHSNAGMVIAVIGVAMLVITVRIHGLRAYAPLGWLSLGGAIPLCATLAALALFDALQPFVQNVLVDAAGAKGGLAAALGNWFHGVYTEWASFSHHALLLLKLLAYWAAASAGLLGVCLLWRRWRPASRSDRGLAIVGAGGALLLTALVLVLYFRGCGRCGEPEFMGMAVLNRAILWSVLLYSFGGALALLVFLVRPRRLTAAAVLVLWLGLGLTWGNGTSAGLSEISAFLGVAVLAGAWFAVAGPTVLPALVPAALLLSFAAYLVEHKFRDPYYWWSIESPDVRKVQCASVEGVLHGLCVPPAKAQGLATITGLVREHSRPGDPIYVFPHMPVFHLLTQRPPFHGAVVSWFDFMSDRQASTVARDMSAAPPAVLVIAQLPELVFSTHERLFRAGGRMGQRDIIAAIDALVANGSIREVGRVKDLDKLEVIVYARAGAAGVPIAPALPPDSR
ncbi:MAG: hypothetical protein JWQ88_3724 [Rhodoferax sp.]|nr:hypothetical protein [Rhodoferax sp.]